MDLFQLALQGKYNQMYEYYLIGSVLDQHKDGFLEILRGLCDNPESKPIEFFENEYIFSAMNSNGANVSLRARQTIPIDPGMQMDAAMSTHWHLRYIGQTDFKMDKDRKTMVRNYMDCLTSPNLTDYLVAMGFNLEAKVPIKGHLFHKGRLKIVVSKLYSGSESQLQPITNSSLVEISCVVSSAGQESIAEEVKRFADMLKPFVRMDKIYQLLEETI